MVTGAMGCIGAWTLRHLVEEGVSAIAADLGTDPVRPRLLLSDEDIARVEWLELDVTNTEAVSRAVADNGVSHIIHLAGLQVPFCAANPPLGAAVNVTGTVNIFEAARHNGIRGLAYASSLAALGPAGLYPNTPIPDDAQTAPGTLYGVYKVANEETARIYHQDWGVHSTGLRPAVVYGVGRDQGLSSDLAKAILAAAVGRPFHIRFDGQVCLHHASDTARMFIACARQSGGGARVFNIRNDVMEVAAFADLLKEEVKGARITHATGTPLPVPSDLDDAGLRAALGTVPHTPLQQAIREDVARYRDLAERGLIDLGQLDR